jgi:hypothetical protein
MAISNKDRRQLHDSAVSFSSQLQALLQVAISQKATIHEIRCDHLLDDSSDSSGQHWSAVSQHVSRQVRYMHK